MGKEARRENTDNWLMLSRGGGGRQMRNRKGNNINSHCSLSAFCV